MKFPVFRGRPVSSIRGFLAEQREARTKRLQESASGLYGASWRYINHASSSETGLGAAKEKPKTGYFREQLSRNILNARETLATAMGAEWKLRGKEFTPVQRALFKRIRRRINRMGRTQLEEAFSELSRISTYSSKFPRQAH